MSFLVVMPTIYPPYRDECIATMSQTMLDNLLVVENSVNNRGLAGSWNIGARRVLEEGLDWLVTISAGMRFGESGGDDFFAQLDTHPDAWVIEGGWDIHKRSELFSGWHYIAWSRRNVLDRIGILDENFWPIYCLAPETKILTADLRWVALGDLEVGANLIGVEEGPPGPGSSRSYVPSRVTDLRPRMAECVRLSLEDGRQVDCTLDHRWLTQAPVANASAWRRTDKLKVGYRIFAPLNVWSTDTTYEAGWLSGLFDGEGCLHISPRLRGVTLTQNEGLVLDRAKQILAAMGIPFTSSRKSPESKTINLDISIRRYVLEVLGRLRPVRLLQNAGTMWQGPKIRSRTEPGSLRIEEIEPLGVREVVSMETSSHTFLANGMVSHNCEDADWSVRILTALEETPNPEGIVRWLKSDVDAWLVMAQHSGELAGIRNDYVDADRYFVSKWGRSFGDGLIPTYKRPFNGLTLPLSFWPTPPDPRAREHDGWALYD